MFERKSPIWDWAVAKELLVKEKNVYFLHGPKGVCDGLWRLRFNGSINISSRNDFMQLGSVMFFYQQIMYFSLFYSLDARYELYRYITFKNINIYVYGLCLSAFFV